MDDTWRSETRTLRMYDKRILIKETDKWKELLARISVLKKMLEEYF